MPPAQQRWPACSRSPAGRRSWPWPLARTHGEGFDCPALDTLFLAAPVANKGSLTQYVGRILRSQENKTTAEVPDYLDERTGVLAAMLAKRAPGYAGLGFTRPAQTRTHSKREHGQLTGSASHLISC